MAGRGETRRRGDVELRNRSEVAGRRVQFTGAHAVEKR